MTTRREKITQLAKEEHALLATIQANSQRNVAGMDYDEREQFHVEQTLLRTDLMDVQRAIQIEINKGE